MPRYLDGNASFKFLFSFASSKIAELLRATQGKPLEQISALARNQYAPEISMSVPLIQILPEQWTYTISEKLLQPNNLDSLFTIFASLQSLSAIQEVIEFATVYLETANPELQAVVMGFCQQCEYICCCT